MPPRRLVLAAALSAVALAGCGGDSEGGGSASSGAPGEEEYRRYACASCHSLDGSEGTGPSFKGLAGSTVTLEGGKKVKATTDYIRRSILEPDAQIHEGYSAGLMSSTTDAFDLGSKPADVDRLVEFIESVK